MIQPTQLRGSPILKVVTVLYDVYSKIISYKYSPIDICRTAVPCKIYQKKKNQTVWKSVCCSGIAIAIFDMVAKEMGTDYELYIVEDGSFGELRNGTWNGMINEIFTKRADVAVQIISPTAERNAVADFTVGITGKTNYLGFLLRREASHLLVVNWAFAKSLQPYLLLAIGVTITILISVLVIFECIASKFTGTKLYPVTEAFSYVSGILFQRDLGGVTPPHWSARVVSIVYAFGMMLLTSSYTAYFTAVSMENIPNSNFHEKVSYVCSYV